MFTLKSAAILALLGSAFAAPLAHRDLPEVGRVYTDPSDPNTKIVYVYAGQGNNNNNNNDDDDSSSVVNVYGGNGHGHGSGSYQPDTSSSSSPSSNAPAPAASSSASTGSSGTPATAGASADYMTVVNTWRKNLGLKDLTESSKLQGNALKTAQDGNGQMVHELNPGTFGQVLAPGTASDFEKVFVGGWLCEKPNMSGLGNICDTMKQGWDHSSGETGHADILTDTKYASIGCALADGIWACDVA